MSAWVECFVSIRFDLDIGPKVEYVVPSDALNEEGARKVVQSAFPDCNPDSGHDFIFFFTMPDCTNAAIESKSHIVVSPSSGTTVPPLWGAAYYRQKKDVRVPRGYVQQMVVLLSRLPYITVHELILRTVMPCFCQCCPHSPDIDCALASSCFAPQPTTFFNADYSFNNEHFTQNQVLDQALNDIGAWSSPHPHVKYDLILLHQELSFVTPNHSLRLSKTQHHAIPRPHLRLDEHVVLLGKDEFSQSSQELIPLYLLLSRHIKHLTKVWELLICHEHLFILSNTPSMASAAAFALISLVMPIQFNGALCSYFTISAEDFSRFSRLGKAIPFPPDKSHVVAATNPFFVRSFDGWQNLISIVDHQTSSSMGACLSPSSKISRSAANISPGTAPPRQIPRTHPSPIISAARGGGGTTLRISVDHSGSDDTGYGGRSAPSALGAAEHSTGYLAPQRSSHAVSQVSSPLFTKESYERTFATAMVPSKNANPTTRESLQHQVTDYFESPFPFLLDHADQTNTLLHRLKRMSELEGDAQLQLIQRYPVSPSPSPSSVQTPSKASNYAWGSTGSPASGGDSSPVGQHHPTFHSNLHLAPGEVNRGTLNPNGRSPTSSVSIPQSPNRCHSSDESSTPVELSHTSSRTTLAALNGPRGGNASPVGNTMVQEDRLTLTAHSQFTIADDVTRKFFDSLTKEFLRPVTAWFNELTNGFSPFMLCDFSTASSLLTNSRFLTFFNSNSAANVPRMLAKRSVKECRGMYERFAKGTLFTAYISSLVKSKLRGALSTFNADTWCSQYPQQAERIDHFISLHDVVRRELTDALDPDILLITEGTAVLAEMALFIDEPQRDAFLSKVEALKLS